jgi:hypothetical protein
MITKNKKAIPLKARGSPEAAKTLPRSALLRKCKLKFGRKRESGENFLQQQLSIYRGEGGQFQELASIRPMRDFRRTRVHSDVPRVTFFY